MFQKYLYNPTDIGGKLLLLFLRSVYRYTRYLWAVGIEELFYSPEGFGVHTVITAVCLVVLIASLYDDMSMIRDMVQDLVVAVKTLREEINRS